MNSPVYVKKYDTPRVDMKEALRYAGAKDMTDDIRRLMTECITESEGVLAYKVCYIKVPVSIEDSFICFPFGEVKSDSLALNLKGCSEAVIFAATIGLGFDRLISKYIRISPSKGVLLQGYGAERIESLCDEFNSEISEAVQRNGLSTRPRFSPGYGDLSVDFQKKLFEVLDCSRKIGLTLNESMMMSPSKSVTAIIGISEECAVKGKMDRNCQNCTKENCEFRS